MKRLTEEKLRDDLLEVRRLIEAESELLLGTYDPLLVQYCLITAAIALGQNLQQSPHEFCDTVAKVVGLYCGDKPGESPRIAVIEFPGGE